MEERTLCNSSNPLEADLRMFQGENIVEGLLMTLREVRGGVHQTGLRILMDALNNLEGESSLVLVGPETKDVVRGMRKALESKKVIPPKNI